MLVEWGWPGTLSVICRFLMTTLHLPNIPWLQGWTLVEPFSEQHYRDQRFEVMLPEDGQIFFVCFCLESVRILRKEKARLDHMSGCVATYYHALNPGACFALLWIYRRSCWAFCKYTVGPVGRFLPKQAFFVTFENLPRIIFYFLVNFF